MTGDIQELEKESFWREHQDTLVRIRHDLVSGKNSRSKFSPAGGVRKRTPNGVPGIKNNKHPPFGKYRRTPSPLLPKLSPQPQQGKNSPLHNGRSSANKFDVIPPLKPKLAFAKPVDDYDSWGEESDDEDDEEEDSDEAYTENPKATNKGKNRKSMQKNKKGRRYKPQPYPSPMPAYMGPPVVYGAPFPVYYPPPPKGARRDQKSKKHPNKRLDKNRTYQDIHESRRGYTSKSGIPVPTKKKQKKPAVRHSVPMYTTPYPFMPAMPVMYPPTIEDDSDDDEEEDEMIKAALDHMAQHPLFASDYVDFFIQDCIHTELLPDFLIETLNEIKRMPYDHPLYVPSLYACEDLLSDHVSEMVMDIAREAATDAANDYLDEKRLQRDPLEDFLTDLIEDAVRLGTREVVRSTIVQLAEDYMETQFATGLIHNLVDDYLDEIGPELLDDVTFDLIAEEFIEAEVIAAEVKEEAEVVARETVQHYDNKVMRREFKEVSHQAKDKLADTVMLEYLLSIISQQGKLWTQEDHVNRHLDDLILNTGLGQMFSVQKQRDKTLTCKPLHKLHEKAVSDVALDVFLQHLTRSLDEDLADVDEYERGVTDGTVYPFPLMAR